MNITGESVQHEGSVRPIPLNQPIRLSAMFDYVTVTYGRGYTITENIQKLTSKLVSGGNLSRTDPTSRTTPPVLFMIVLSLNAAPYSCP